jgi:hypothetical protein
MIAEIVQFVVAMAVALALAYGIGLYMSLLIKGEPRPFETPCRGLKVPSSGSPASRRMRR